MKMRLYDKVLTVFIIHYSLLIINYSLKIVYNFPVAMRFGETLIPIPNMTVKPLAAEGTWRVTARENRWLPDSFK